MADEVTFIDLACLLKITPDTTLEKLGSAINASVFDASNIAGTLKKEGLIDFSAYYPGPNTVVVTDAGKALIAEADTKSAEPFDNLDDAVLFQLSGGKRKPMDLQSSLNIRSKDLALRIYKLTKQGFVSYELKSGSADITLTESGFLKAKSSSIPRPPAQQPAAPAMQQTQPQPAPAQAAPGAAATTPPADQPQGNAQATPVKLHGKPLNPLIYVAIVVIILVIIGALYYTGALKGI